MGKLLKAAAGQRPDVILLPECTNFMGRNEQVPENSAKRDGPWFEMFSDFARKEKLEIIAGLLVRSPILKAFNIACSFNREGVLQTEYRKIHLFDVELADGDSFLESAAIEAGDNPVTGEVAGIPSGFAICYDLRFPELFRILTLAGAKVIYVPSAFTALTGEAHWKTLISARAIENQVFIVAANQVGPYAKNKSSYGHSMIVDPWGRILAEAPGIGKQEVEAVIMASLDFSLQEKVRREFPCLSHVRFNAGVSPKPETVYP